ncbi:MAG: (d)CMP kinase [Methanoregulaceae archaeon]|nr:(d)CMP kinase [Methanoregulaceae archaeon]
MTDIPVITIDGPSASGKGTVAQLVARQLGFHYLDSGALYRVLALAATQRGVPLDDEAGLARLASGLDIRFEDGNIWLQGMEVNDAVRSEECGNNASRIAALPQVREALLGLQRAFRKAPGLVCDGRDMGSVVFPDAATKIFLTASAEVRADRRYKQLMEKGMCANLLQILQDIRQRDARDSARSVAPLQQCADASLLDTSSLTIDQSVAEVMTRFQTSSSCQHP